MVQERTNRTHRARARVVRWLVLGAVFFVVTGVATAHQYINEAGKPVGVDALCPFGGLETLFTLLATGSYVNKIAASSVVLLIGAIVLALLWRRSFCGQICPLGGMQEAFGMLGRRLVGRRLTVPKALDRVARLLKYAVLVYFIIWTWRVSSLVIRPYDPWAAWAHITSDELLTEFGIGVAVLVVSLAGSVLYDRFFCKYLCPTGAFLGIFSRLSFMRLKRDAAACIDCGACDKACPMNIPVSSALTVRDSECISCVECVNACPVSGALGVETPSGRSLSPIALTGAVVATLAILVLGAMAVGRFDWTMPSLKEAIERGVSSGSGGEHAAEGSGDPTSITGVAPNGAEFDTALIKGYMSMQEIAEASGIPEEEFVSTWGVPAEDLDEPMKEIKDQYGFSPDDVRLWVGERLR